MPEFKSDNRRIAKNTLLLYVRMFLIMAVQLYISREILAILGIEDYGIYSVVGGIVSMFSFLNYAMTNTTLRFLTYELGKNNFEKLKQIFVTALNSHFLISIIILLLAETVGLWFLNEKIVIPQTRQTAAFWVYQSAIAIMILSIINAPYNAAIIAHEKMSAYAYISIFDIFLKLAVVFFVQTFNGDKLIFYAQLLILVQIITTFCYWIFCRKNFVETKYFLYKNKSLFKEITSFATWNLWGNAASVLFVQGQNILLNLFFGPIVNAANGITLQVQGALKTFSNSFQTALNPQIIKTYATNQIEEMHNLIFRSCRFSFFLLYIISLPIFLFAPEILQIWLKNVPEFTVIFVRISILTIIIDATANPLMTAANATGKIKLYQSIIGGVLISIVPISYIVLRLGGEPLSNFIVHLCVCIIAYIIRLFFIRNLIKLSIRKFISNVIFRSFFVVLFSIILPLIGYFFAPKNLTNAILLIILSIISAGLTSFFIGLNSNERNFFIKQFQKILHK